MYEKWSVQGNVIEVTELDSKNSCCHALKLDVDHWVDENGEIHDYVHDSTSRLDNASELRRSFARIRALVNTNCSDTSKLLWVTLTYAENMRDTRRLYRDFQRFVQRFRTRWGHADYIAVVEPQERGAWHMHVLFVFQGKAPWVQATELERCWGNGFVKLKSVNSVDNVGAYLSAYLGDVEVPVDSKNGEVKTFKDGTRKKFVKGGRLRLYPPGMNLYRCSRGIRKPEEHWVESEGDLEKVKALTQNATQTFAKEFTWTDEQGQSHRCFKRFYNTKRCG